MKIAINTVPLLSPLTGVGNYIYQICKSLKILDTANDYTYFYGYYSKRLIQYDERKDIFPKVKDVIKKLPVFGSSARKLKGILNNFSFRRFDLYFEPNFIPINIRAKRTITTVFDFSFKLYPEWHTKERVNYFEKNFWKKIKNTDRIIVSSDFIKEEGIRLFGLPEDKLKTIYLGLNCDIFKIYEPEDLQSVRNEYSLPKNFILFVGSIEPRKNLANLIRAFISLDKNIRKDFKIVLAGFKGWGNKEIMGLIERVRQDVVYIGYIPGADLGKLYNLAKLFIYPSYYEGFGLPPLEAMACGCPVIVSKAASLPEICGDAAYYVDPYNVEDIADGIYKVLKNESLRKTLVDKGVERSKLFRWGKSAKEHIEVFEEVLNL